MMMKIQWTTTEAIRTTTPPMRRRSASGSPKSAIDQKSHGPYLTAQCTVRYALSQSGVGRGRVALLGGSHRLLEHDGDGCYVLEP